MQDGCWSHGSCADVQAVVFSIRRAAGRGRASRSDIVWLEGGV